MRWGQFLGGACIGLGVGLFLGGAIVVANGGWNSTAAAGVGSMLVTTGAIATQRDRLRQ